MDLSFVEIRVLLDYYYAELEFCDRRDKEIKEDSYPNEIKNFEYEAVRNNRKRCNTRIKELEIYKANKIK